MDKVSIVFNWTTKQVLYPVAPTTNDALTKSKPYEIFLFVAI